MTHILHIHASARGERSITRELTGAFLDQWLLRRPESIITRRDVGRVPPPAISEDWIAAAFAGDGRTAAQRELLSLSEELIEEVFAADLILIGAPMYNYGMPAALKAWFDQVIRVDRTFTFDLARGHHPLEPVLTDKQLVVMATWGEFGFGPGEPNADHGHLIPHIRSCSRYLGATTVEHLSVEYQEFGDARHEASKRAAFDAMPTLVEQLQAAGPDSRVAA